MCRKDIFVKELKYNIKCLITKKELYFAIFVILIINLIHVVLCVNESMRLNHFYEQFHTAEYQFILYNINVSFQTLMIIIFPIVCSMILSDVNVSENKSRLTNILFERIDYKKNILIRTVLCTVITTCICFIGFLFNYLVLRIIYGSGNNITLTQGVGFELMKIDGFFLDNIRIMNPVLFVFLINFFVSIIYGLLTSLSYCVSLFIKNKLIVYFIPLIFTIMTDMILNVFSISSFSIASILQPFGRYNLINYMTSVGVLIIVIVVLLLKKFRNKDIII